MKKRQLPKREFEICSRLKEIREELHLGQKEFGQQVGMTRERIASYEAARAPLRYDLALKICRQFIISEKWLAIGKGDKRSCMDLTTENPSDLVRIDMPFGAAYDAYFGALYEKYCRENKGLLRLSIHENEHYSYIENLFLYLLHLWKGRLRTGEFRRFLSYLIELGVAIMTEKEINGELPELVKVKGLSPVITKNAPSPPDEAGKGAN